MLDDLRALFRDPPRTFAPAPMWFLNGELTEDEMARQLRDFADKGVGGVILHPRIGLSREIGYLSDRFMALIAFAVETAQSLGLSVILYDEGMYPSGSACGGVCREDPSFASRGITLEWGEIAPGEGRRLIARIGASLKSGGGYDARESRLLAKGEAPRDGETLLLIVEDFTRGTIRGVHEGQDDGEPDAPPSADILNPAAVGCFIRLTHERYYAALSRYFGNTITAMFVDEPCPMGRCVSERFRAWTGGLEEELSDAGLTLVDLPALWLDAGADTARVRNAYEALIDKRLGAAFYAPISAWCSSHGIALTGHPARPGDLSLERCFGVPGQDLVWRFVDPEKPLEGAESTLAKCASDGALYGGKRRSACECFGVCGKDGKQWTFTVDEMLFYLNWLFVRGVNTIYPHAFFYAMDTPTQRGDRPPDVGPNNIWWPWYGQIARYIASTCALLTDGAPVYRVAVVCAGTNLPWRLPAALYRSQIPFAYLEESLLTERAQIGERAVCIAGQRYEALLFEDAALMDDERVRAALRGFRGRVLVLGTDGCETPEDVARALPDLWAVTFDRPAEDLRVHPYRRQERTLYYLSNEGAASWRGHVTLPEPGYCERFDPWAGSVAPLPCENGSYELSLCAGEATLLAVAPAQAPLAAALPTRERIVTIPLSGAWRAEWPGGALDTAPLGDWQSWEGMALYGGTVTYSTSFRLDTAPDRLTLRLGHVRDLAVVSLNGGEARPLLRSPFACELTSDARVGENELTVRVTSCRISELEHKPCPGGLFGAATLDCIFER